MEILFRGFHECDGPETIVVDGKKVRGEWVYGFYCRVGWCGQEEDYIIPSYASACTPIEVIPSTVGQFTGLTDKNGKRSFVGDRVKTHYANAPKADFIENIVFRNGRFCAEGRIGKTGKCWSPLADGVPHVAQDKSVYMDSFEVIGTIYDEGALNEMP